jgi:hypothetical protein
MAACFTVGNDIASVKIDCADKDNHNVHISTLVGGVDLTVKDNTRVCDSEPASFKYTTDKPSIFDIPTGDGKYRSVFSFK